MADLNDELRSDVVIARLRRSTRVEKEKLKGILETPDAELGPHGRVMKRAAEDRIAELQALRECYQAMHTHREMTEFTDG